MASLVEDIETQLGAMQRDLFNKAKAFRDSNTFEIDSLEDLKKRAEDGFLLAHWCESPTCEAKVKEEATLTTRCRPFDLPQTPGKCVVCGEPSPGRMVFSRAY